MNVVPVMLKKVNGYTTATIKRGSERFFVASKKASEDEIKSAVRKLSECEISDLAFFYLPNGLPLRKGMDIAVVSRTIEEGNKTYTRILPRSVIRESKLPEDLGERSVIVERDKKTKKGITAIIRPDEKYPRRNYDSEVGFYGGYYYPYRTADWYSNGASKEEIDKFSHIIAMHNLR